MRRYHLTNLMRVILNDKRRKKEVWGTCGRHVTNREKDMYRPKTWTGGKVKDTE